MIRTLLYDSDDYIFFSPRITIEPMDVRVSVYDSGYCQISNLASDFMSTCPLIHKVFSNRVKIM